MTNKYKYKLNITKKYKGGAAFNPKRPVIKTYNPPDIKQKRLEKERLQEERLKQQKLVKLLEYKEEIKKSQIDLLTWNIQWERMSANKPRYQQTCMDGDTNNCLNNVANYINLFKNLDIICLQEVENWDKIHTIIKKDNMKYVHTTHTMTSGNEVQLVTLYNSDKFTLLGITYALIIKNGRHYHALYFKDFTNNLFIVINLHNGHYKTGNEDGNYTINYLENNLFNDNVIWVNESSEYKNLKIKLNTDNSEKRLKYPDTSDIPELIIDDKNIGNTLINEFITDVKIQKRMIVMGDFNDTNSLFTKRPFLPLKNSKINILNKLSVSKQNSNIPKTCCDAQIDEEQPNPGDYILISDNLKYDGVPIEDKIYGMKIPNISNNEQIANESVNPNSSDHLPVYSKILLPLNPVPEAELKPDPLSVVPPIKFSVEQKSIVEPKLPPPLPPAPIAPALKPAPKSEPAPAPEPAPKPEPIAAAPKPLITGKPAPKPAPITPVPIIPAPKPAPITQPLTKKSYLRRLVNAATKKIFLKKETTPPSPAPIIKIKKNEETQLKESINNLLIKLDIQGNTLSDDYYGNLLTNINNVLQSNVNTDSDPELELKEKIHKFINNHFNIQLDLESDTFYNEVSNLPNVAT
jgi:endonuclease/exonuclease/phosphatase family metal-dependent hydrolase